MVSSPAMRPLSGAGAGSRRRCAPRPRAHGRRRGARRRTCSGRSGPRPGERPRRPGGRERGLELAGLAAVSIPGTAAERSYTLRIPAPRERGGGGCRRAAHATRGSTRRARAARRSRWRERAGIAAAPKRASHGTSASRGCRRNGLSRRPIQRSPSRIAPGLASASAWLGQIRPAFPYEQPPGVAAALDDRHARAAPGQLVRGARPDRSRADRRRRLAWSELDITRPTIYLSVHC